MKRRNWEELFIAFSLANLLLVMSWRRLLYPNTDFYHIKYPPTYLDYLSVILTVIFVSVVLYGGLALVRYFFKDKATYFARIVFYAILICIANAVRMAFPQQQLWLMNTFGVSALLIIFGIVVIIGLILAIKYWDRVFSVFRLVVLVFSPFVLVTFFNAAKEITAPTEGSPNSIEYKTVGEGHSDKSNIKARVIWIIFDELDFRAAFEIRPEDVKMPEFDRLLTESFSATNAVSPNYQTLQAIPSLLVGKKIDEAVPLGKSELLLNFSDGEKKAKLTEAQTVFSDVKRMGGKSATVGWYHAYCRVLQKDLSACHWEGFDFGNDFKSQNFSQSISRDLYNLSTSVPLAIRYLKTLEDDDYIARHKRLLKETNEIIKNPEIDLALIHLPFPHNPYRFSRKSDKFIGSGDYLDNLVLTDKVLGEIRIALEKEGLWEDSVVIVSSDHQWRLDQLKFSLTEREVELTKRKEDERIPFIIKMNGQKESLIYEKPFNTVVTRGLIRSIMKGEVSTAEEVDSWLDENAVK